MSRRTLKDLEHDNPVLAAVWREHQLAHLDRLLIDWSMAQLRDGYDDPTARAILDAHEAHMRKLADFGGAAGGYWSDRLQAEQERRERATRLGLAVADRIREQAKSDERLARFAGDTPLLTEES